MFEKLKELCLSLEQISDNYSIKKNGRDARKILQEIKLEVKRLRVGILNEMKRG